MRRIANLIRNRKQEETVSSFLTFTGDYASWDEALQHTTSYENDDVFDKVLESTKAVINDEAAFERDGMLFDKFDYNWPLVSYLLNWAIRHDGQLKVVDFGGSMGSSFFHNRHFLSELNVQWTVVEQPKLAAIAQKEIKVEGLRFIDDINSLSEEDVKGSLLLCSSVLQYIPNPYDYLKKFREKGFEAMILDRVAFWDQDRDILTNQYVHASFVESSYPVYFFGHKPFMDYLVNNLGYEIKTEFHSYCDGRVYSVDGVPVYHNGFYLELKK